MRPVNVLMDISFEINDYKLYIKMSVRCKDASARSEKKIVKEGRFHRILVRDDRDRAKKNGNGTHNVKIMTRIIQEQTEIPEKWILYTIWSSITDCQEFFSRYGYRLNSNMLQRS